MNGDIPGNDDAAYVRVETVKTKKGKTLLHDMEILFPPKSVTAIMGPSGSGKTTLMGTIINHIQSNVRAVAEGESAFVPQEDVLHGFYTCRKYLEHYSRLTGYETDKKQREEHIMELLTSLGLQDQADTIVGDLFLKGLSGGQKRRLSVALEAFTTPKNFFLDEPTSGLDAESALQVMDFLKQYARASPDRRVIVTIHQPSSHIWQLIDNVVLLSKGRLMYSGPRVCMERFFAEAGHPTPSSFNPADHYVTIVNDEFSSNVMEVTEWEEKFRGFQIDGLKCPPVRQSLRVLDEQEAIATQRSKSPLVALELTYRYFLNLWFNPGILGTRVAMYSMLSLMVGALFWDLGEENDFASVQARSAILFYCVAFFIFMSVAVLPFTVMERAIVDKEVLNGYYNPIYYQVAQAISSIPAAALLAFLTTLIIITMTKLDDPLWYYLIMFLSLSCAEAFAQLVSHVVPHFIIGMALLAGMYGFFMLFMGFMIIPSNFPNWLAWTYYIGFHTYSWRTFMYTEFSSLDTIVGGSGEFTTGQSVLQFYEIDDVNRSNDMVVLACYTIIVHILSCVVVHIRYNWLNGTIIPPSDKKSTSIAEKSGAEEAAPLEAFPEEEHSSVEVHSEQNGSIEYTRGLSSMSMEA